MPQSLSGVPEEGMLPMAETPRLQPLGRTELGRGNCGGTPPRGDSLDGDPSLFSPSLLRADLRLDWKTGKCPRVVKWSRPREGEEEGDSGEWVMSQGEL